MVPAVFHEPLSRSRSVGVRADHLEAHRLGVRPVRVVKAKLSRRHPLVLERLHHGMDLGDVEDPARLHEVGGHARPCRDVGQPAEHAARGVDDVEVPIERIGQVVQVRDDERRRDREVRGQCPRGSDALLAEVRARDDRAEAPPRKGVESEVALQMEERLAGDVADLLDLVVAQADAVLPAAERGDVVELGCDVDPGPGIPDVAVPAQGLVHRHRVYGQGPRVCPSAWSPPVASGRRCRASAARPPRCARGGGSPPASAGRSTTARRRTWGGRRG